MRPRWVDRSSQHIAVLAAPMGAAVRGLEKYGQTASRLVSRAATRSLEDEVFAAMVKTVEGAVIDILDILSGPAVSITSTTVPGTLSKGKAKQGKAAVTVLEQAEGLSELWAAA